MAEVRLSGISKSFGDVEVLRDVDLTVADGELVVFVGPSGCGKTTLLRVIAGLEPVDAGEVSIAGRVVNDDTPAERGVAMVFQSYALYPQMSVYENMAFALKIAKRSSAEIETAVRQAARNLSIEHLLHRKPRTLSGGERQRVAIGRAIVRRPAAFLFDEPLSNLDATLRVRTRYEFTKLHKDLGATMVYVTHDQVEAMTLADRIVVLSRGRIEQIGAPLTLYEQPSNLFVAGFIGSPKMNFFAGVVAEAGSEHVRVKFATGEAVAVAVSGEGCAPGAAVTLGVRPEHLVANAVENAISVSTKFVELLGGTTLVYATVPSSADDVVVQMNTEAAAPRIGEELSIGVPAHAAHIFAADGRALPRLTRAASKPR